MTETERRARARMPVAVAAEPRSPRDRRRADDGSDCLGSSCDPLVEAVHTRTKLAATLDAPPRFRAGAAQAFEPFLGRHDHLAGGDESIPVLRCVKRAFDGIGG